MSKHLQDWERQALQDMANGPLLHALNRNRVRKIKRTYPVKETVLVAEPVPFDDPIPF